MIITRTLRNTAAPLCAAAASVFLSGCANFISPAPQAASTAATTTTTGTSLVDVYGTVFGGQQPVSGATITLYAVGNTGYGSAYPYTTGTSLLGNNVVTTNANGAFSLKGLFTCPSSNPYVYIVATGGQPVPGLAANSNLAMMTALGPCLSLTQSTVIHINELTTVASVWALAPFMSGPTAIGTSPTNAVGVANAFAAVNNIVNTSNGTLPGPTLPATATIPTAEINSLANLLASCINSAGGTTSGTACGNLFALAVSSTGTQPGDTITAAMNIAKNPAQNAAGLNGLIPTIAPYQPNLGTTPPAAWTIAIRYGGLSAPKGIAADNNGNIWVANTGNTSVVELNTAGGVTGNYATGYAGSAIALDPSGNAFVSTINAGYLLKISPSGSPTPFGGGGLGATTSLAVDGSGNVWATGPSLSGFTNAGVPLTGSAYSGGGLSSPQSIAITAK